MKKFLLILLVPLVVSAAAIAAPNPASVTAHCNNLLRQGSTYPTLQACVAAKNAQAAQITAKASVTCKAARATDAAAFATLWGKNANDKNAFGKCVSTTSKAAAVAQQTVELNAAKWCKKERTDLGAATFTAKYGGKKNAFGKCVSQRAKAQHS